MSQNRKRGNHAVSGVNPQGYSGGGNGDTSPKSKLEEAAKKSSTKR
ncbi:small acid-soluble spore protein L (minor) [Bacillus ectoiniformans]|nr:small, acid-soluble spore protein L [Bacillus ectoiniformans]MBM7648064.1 small acid-soluble spore protein L (minor) [Bacillus ectoiniformans]